MSAESATSSLDAGTIDRLFALFDSAEQVNPLTLDAMQVAHAQSLQDFFRTVRGELTGLAVWLQDQRDLKRRIHIGNLPGADRTAKLIRREIKSGKDGVDYGWFSGRDTDTYWGLAQTRLCTGQSIVLESQLTAPPSDDLRDALKTFSRIVAEDYRRVLLGALVTNAEQTQKCDTFLHSIHGLRDSGAILTELVNDGASVCDVDRMSVFRLNGKKPKLIAVTGVTKVERRAKSVDELERLVRTCLAEGSDEHERLLEQYVADSECEHARLDALDCEDNRGPAHVLLTEQYDSRPFNEPILQKVRHHTTLALKNAGDWESGTGWGAVGRWTKPFRSRFALTTIVAVGLLAALMCGLETDFTLAVEGQLQPMKKHIVFAPADAIVVEQLVEDETPVKSGEVLLRTTSTGLQLREETISGEYETTQAQLASVRAARLNPDASNQSMTPEQLTARDVELQRHLESLEKQLTIVRRELESLSIRAQSDGVAFEYNQQDQLLGQPVRYGQPLLQIIEPSHGWHLELRVPDRILRHVLEANQNGEVKVTYRLQMAPENQHETRIASLSEITELESSGRLSSQATALVDLESSECRPGASVVATVHCGKRKLGYVWSVSYTHLTLPTKRIV